MVMRFILGCAVLGVAAGILNSSVDESISSPAFLYTVAPRYEPLAWMHGRNRFPSGSAIYIHGSRGERALMPNFAATADPAVSFDGQRMLFAGKQKPDEPWGIWELPVAGGDARKITRETKDDCIRPLYLPDDRIVYARQVAGRFRIETSDLSGRNVLTLTYGPANFLPANILRDGRILFDAGYPLGSDRVPEIYTVYSDGSGVESYRCDHGKSRHNGAQVSSGDIVFASSSGLSRFTSARAREIPTSAPAGEYEGDVAELRSGAWLLARRTDSNHNYEIATWTPASPVRKVVAASHADAVQPVPLDARPAPNRHPSGLHDWDDANLLCLNAYTSKYAFSAGSIHAVRVYEQSSQGKSMLLGTAPVERDGSFFIHVPGDRPLQIELMDASGKTLKRESGFFWMRRGEQRVCVGCHAGPETAPENAVPQILLKSTTPADLTGVRTGPGASR